MNTKLAWIVIALVAIASAATFESSPTLTRDGSNRLWVEFQVSESTDVAVSIVDLRDSSIIRHLAAGVLGSKAPAPLAPNTLQQRIEWDGKDDLGFAVPNPELMKARVRAGLGVRLDQLLGDNPYSFSGGMSGRGGGIFGMEMDVNGNIIVAGNPGALYHSHWSKFYKLIRVYDNNGNYLRTIYPMPSNLPAARTQGWSVAAYPAGAYTPRLSATSIMGYTPTIISMFHEPFASGLLYMDSSDNVVFGTQDSALAFGTDGGITGNGGAYRFIRNPALPRGTAYSQSGTAMITLMPGRKSAFVTGFFNAVLSSGWLTQAVDTGFYRDGRVFKVDLTTGNTSVWLDLDTVIVAKADRFAALQGQGYYAAIHGTAVDHKGRVYVCDRFNRRIGVYDSNATLLGQIPLPAADKVEISARTGAIYATTRLQSASGVTTGQVRLFKFSPWDAGAAPVCSLVIASTVGNTAYPTYLVVNETTPETRIWIGYMTSSVRIYQDAGTQLNLIKALDDSAKTSMQGFSRMAVDRKSETVYINDDWGGLYQIEDWNNPVIRPCSTSTNKRLFGTDLTISPHGMLYVRENSTFHGPVTRYSLARRHEPLNWANTGKNMLTPDVLSRGEGAGFGERGLAVNTDNEVAVERQLAGGGHHFAVSFYADSGSATDTLGKIRIKIPSTGGLNKSGGVQYDLQGNLYLGIQALLTHPVPTAFVGDWAYAGVVGSIVKFPAQFDSGSMSSAGVITGASKTYSLGLAPFSNEKVGGCQCRSPRFYVDPYGRIFSPNAVACHVSVADNEDNPIIRFGQYGNVDSRGGLPGPGQTIAVPAVPLAYPVSVAATEDFIYVADFGNQRLARLQMTYGLDNHPEISSLVEGETSSPEGAATLQSYPNPFNPSGLIKVTLGQKTRIRLDVFAPDGRFIRTLASDLLNSGRHEFSWDGTDRRGGMVSTGVYYLRLRAGRQELCRPVTLVR